MREWAEQGNMKLLKYAALTLTDETIPPFWFSHDVEKGYDVRYDPSDLSKIVAIVEDPGINWLYKADHTPAEFAGLRLPSTDVKLDELLDGAKVRADGVETIGESRCWRINVGTYTGRTGQLIDLVVAFDPSHGYLPRRIVVQASRKDADAQELKKTQSWEENFEIVDFQKVIDPLTKRERWFPHEAQFRNIGDDLRFVIDEVSLNAPIPIERFRPTPAGGDRNHSRTTQSGRTGEVVYFWRASGGRCGHPETRRGGAEFELPRRGRRYAP